MNYYKRHIGDYAAATRHLSMLEHGAYTMLLDTYYTTEQPLPVDVKAAARKAGARSKDEVAAVEVVLAEFFTLQADGWHSARCDVEIAAYQSKAESNRVVGTRGGRPKKPPKNNHDGFVLETHMVSENDDSRNHPGTLTTNHKPLTINQGAFVEHQQGGPDGPAHADFENGNAGDSGTDNREAQAVAEAMRAAGLADVSATNPKLRALLAAGLTPAELLAAAAYAVGSGKGFAYAMARAEGQRRDAATAASLPAAPSVAAVDPDSKAGIEASAKALSLPGWDQTAEQWPQFAARVRKARGDAPAQHTLSLADLARIGVSA
jgi:uncharacterized protein YdaU (DUF1376 family)